MKSFIAAGALLVGLAVAQIDVGQLNNLPPCGVCIPKLRQVLLVADSIYRKCASPTCSLKLVLSDARAKPTLLASAGTRTLVTVFAIVLLSHVLNKIKPLSCNSGTVSVLVRSESMPHIRHLIDNCEAYTGSASGLSTVTETTTAGTATVVITTGTDSAGKGFTSTIGVVGPVTTAIEVTLTTTNSAGSTFTTVVTASGSGTAPLSGAGGAGGSGSATGSGASPTLTTLSETLTSGSASGSVATVVSTLGGAGGSAVSVSLTQRLYGYFN